MTKGLFVQAIWKFALGVILIGLLLFLPAGSFAYWNAWLFMAVLFVPMFLAGIVMMVKNPELLRKRLNAREREAEQGTVIKLSGIMFILGFVVAGLNFRYGWMILPDCVSWAGAAVFLLAYALYAEVLRENTYLSRTIEVQAGQRVIDTGLYGVVRHPMYCVTLVLFLSMPFVLGCVYSAVIFLAYPPLIAKRIRNEEEVLEAELPGYAEYQKRVRYKVIPFVW